MPRSRARERGSFFFHEKSPNYLTGVKINKRRCHNPVVTNSAEGGSTCCGMYTEALTSIVSRNHKPQIPKSAWEKGAVIRHS